MPKRSFSFEEDAEQIEKAITLVESRSKKASDETAGGRPQRKRRAVAANDGAHGVGERVRSPAHNEPTGLAKEVTATRSPSEASTLTTTKTGAEVQDRVEQSPHEQTAAQRAVGRSVGQDASARVGKGIQVEHEDPFPEYEFVDISSRLHPSIKKAWRRAAFERTENRIRPGTQQAILNEALHDWLVRHHYDLTE